LNKKFDLSFKEVQSIKLEMQDKKLKMERLENNPNEKTTGDRRTNRETVAIGGMRASTYLGMMMMKLSVGLKRSSHIRRCP